MNRHQRLVHQRSALVAAFGETVGSVVHDWALQNDLLLLELRRLEGGRTAATVFMAYVKPADGPARRLVIKLSPAQDDTGALCEPGRHARALRLNRDFADRHLVRFAREPFPVGDGAWLLVLHVAGAGQRRIQPLSVLLDSVAQRRRASVPPYPLKSVTSVCRTLVRSLLVDWAPQGPDLDGMDVPSFLTRNLDGRLGPNGSLRRWLEEQAPQLLDPSKPWVSLPGADQPLPNPVALVTDPSLTHGLKVRASIGPGHGDEHPGNIIVPTRPTRRASEFWLIDLSRFAPDAPLSRGPVHLQLSIVASYLDDLTPSARDALIPFLIDPTDDRRGYVLPSWLVKVIRAIAETVHLCVGEWSLGEDWEVQTRLSLVACALVFAGRRTTPRAHRTWYLRLAAEAALAFLVAEEERQRQGLLGRLNGEPPIHLPGTLVTPGEGWDPARLPPSETAVEPGPLPDPALPVPSPTTPSPGPSPTPTPDVLPMAASGSAPASLPPSPPPAAVMPGDGVEGAPTRVTAGRGRARVVAPELLARADALAERVKRDWEDAAAGRRLLQPTPISVRWARADRPVVGPLANALGHPSAVDGAAPCGPLVTPESLLRGEIDHLLEVYCGLPSGRLVIMGNPGAGKTAAAIRLTLAVLRYREARPHAERADVAVPIILTPHDWDPERQPMSEWLAQRLAADYPVLRGDGPGCDVADRLVREGLVALVLDGLDDMPEAARSAALRALDQQGRLRVVVVCRSAEMVAAAADGHLTAAVAVELQPVEAGEAAAYLVRCGTDPLPPDWQRLVDHLRKVPDGPVAQALDSPLMLGLVRDTYKRDDDVDELLDETRFPNRGAVEDHLLGRVLPAAYKRRAGEPDPPYSEERSRRWLGYLAHRMDRDNTRDLAWWHTGGGLPRWQPGLVTSLVSGLISGALFAVVGYVGQEALLGLVAGFLYGPGAAVFNARVVSPYEHRGQRSIGLRIASGYVLGTSLTGLLTGVALVGPTGAGVGLRLGLGVGIFFAVPLVIWAVRALRFNVRPTAATSPLTPRACWRQDVRHSSLFALLVGVSVGSTAALVCRAVGESGVTAVGIGVLEALAMGAFSLTFSAWAKTTLAAVQLWVRGCSPVRLVRFLEDARKRNVLRTAGPVYQFRHARLQDVLARSYRSERDADARRRRRWLPWRRRRAT